MEELGKKVRAFVNSFLVEVLGVQPADTEANVDYLTMNEHILRHSRDIRDVATQRAIIHVSDLLIACMEYEKEPSRVNPLENVKKVPSIQIRRVYAQLFDEKLQNIGEGSEDDDNEKEEEIGEQFYDGSIRVEEEDEDVPMIRTIEDFFGARRDFMIYRGLRLWERKKLVSHSIQTISLDTVLSAPSDKFLGQILRNTTLDLLDLRWCVLNLQQIERLCERLYLNRSLEVLDLSGTELGASQMLALSKLIKINPKLSRIVMIGNEVVGVTPFLRELRANSSITNLTFWNNILQPEELSELSQVLGSTKSIRNLQLQSSQIGFRECEILEWGLSRCSSLRHLSLWSNRVGDEGATIISRVIAKSQSIAILSLEMCRIKPTGFLALAEGLSLNSSITDASLSGNEIDQACYHAFFEMLSVNCTLEKLDFKSPQMMTNATATVFLQSLQNFKTLRRLELYMKPKPNVDSDDSELSNLSDSAWEEGDDFFHDRKETQSEKEEWRIFNYVDFYAKINSHNLSHEMPKILLSKQGPHWERRTFVGFVIELAV